MAIYADVRDAEEAVIIAIRNAAKRRGIESTAKGSLAKLGIGGAKVAISVSTNPFYPSFRKADFGVYIGEENKHHADVRIFASVSKSTRNRGKLLIEMSLREIRQKMESLVDDIDGLNDELDDILDF